MPFNQRVTERIPKSSDAPELKPCPFCGHEKIELHNGVEHKHWYQVTCDWCGITTGERPSITIAVGMWNRRTDPDRPAKV